MNSFSGTLQRLENLDRLNWLTAEVNGRLFKIITLELSPVFKPDCPITLMFKESEVVLALGGQRNSTSVDNALPCTIRRISPGQILTEVLLESDCGPLSALLSTEATERLKLSEGIALTALIKPFDISLMEG